MEKTAHEKVLLARHRKVAWGRLNDSLDAIAHACETMDTNALKELLLALVPEHTQHGVETYSTQSAKAKVVYLNN